MMRYIILTLLHLSFASFAQDFKLNTYNFEKVDNLMKDAPKNIVVFLTADCCQFCQNMKVNTFSDDQVIKKLNADFYYLPFDVELSEKVTFRSVVFNPSKIDYHEFAQAISGQKRCTLPYIAIINEKNEILYESEGFVDHKSFNNVLGAFKE
jgi:thioredoxin-related protein